MKELILADPQETKLAVVGFFYKSRIFVNLLKIKISIDPPRNYLRLIFYRYLENILFLMD